MELFDIREAILENVARDDIDTPRLNRYINDTIKRIARYHNWRDLYVKQSIDTTVGVGEYVIPESGGKFKDLVSITLIDSNGKDRKLTAVPYRRMHELVPNPSSEQTGKPRFYVVWGNKANLYPYPDEVYTLETLYVKWPAELESASDEPEITGVDDLIITGATISCFMSLQQKEEVAIWNQQFGILLNESVSSDVKHTDHQMKLQGYRASDRAVQPQNEPLARG